MLKHLTGLICLVCLTSSSMFASAAWADTSTNKDLKTYYSNIADSITEHQIDEDSFEIRSNENTLSMFSIENMKMDVHNTAATKMATQSDVDAEIENIIYGYNQTYLSSLFSGVYQLYPRENFSSDGIYQEANARNLYEMFNKPTAGEGVTSYDFSLDFQQIEVGNTYAKVVVNRNADVIYPDAEVQNVSYGGTEAYLLKQEDGKWKIENIIFATNYVSDLFNDFMNSNDESDWAENYTFNTCHRENYDEEYNFSDYVIGSVEMPSFDIDAANLAYMKDEPTSSEIMPIVDMYSKNNAALYAGRYGADPNRLQYIYISRLEGGDCTNFASQCIRAGGLSDTNGWYYNNSSSYSASWVNVELLRDYLMNNGLARGYYQDVPNYPASAGGVRGTLIQFSDGYSWHHSAIMMGHNYQGYVIAEHTGVDGNTSGRNMGESLTNTRTFWIGVG